MKNLVGSRVRDARLREKLSQEQVVARLQALGVDIDQTALSRIENGERQITDIEIVAICQVLNQDVAALFRNTKL